MRVALCVLCAVSISACASSGAVPRPFPVPGDRPAAGDRPANPTPPPAPKASSPPTGSADGYALAGTALSLRGAPYKNSGADPTGFDCSGFVRYVFGQHGRPLPREVREQFRVGKAVERDRLAPGDLVFFTTVAPGASHVGIAVGGDQFVHAPSQRGVVRVDRLSAQYWASRFVGSKRVN